MSLLRKMGEKKRKKLKKKKKKPEKLLKTKKNLITMFFSNLTRTAKKHGKEMPGLLSY